MKKGVALKGSITIFLAMIFTVLLAFVCVLLENARVSSAASKAEGITYMGLDSCFAEYAKELFDEYGVMYIWSDEQSLIEHLNTLADYNCQNKIKDIYGLRLQSIDMEDRENALDNGGKDFESQVYRYMKYKLGEDALSGLADKVKEKSGFLKDAEKVSDVYNKITECSDEFKDAEECVLNVSKSVKKLDEAGRDAEEMVVGVTGAVDKTDMENKYSEYKTWSETTLKIMADIKQNTDEFDRKSENAEKKAEDIQRYLADTKEDMDEDVYQSLETEVSDICNKFNEADGYGIQACKKATEESEKGLKELDKYMDDYAAGGFGDAEKALSISELAANIKLSDIGLNIEYAETNGDKRDDVSDKVNNMLDGGILKLVVKEPDKLSDKSMEDSEIISEEMEEYSGEDSVIRKAVFGQYILDHLKNYTETVEDTGLCYEVEYVISGEKADKENLANVAKKIAALRSGFNMISILRDSVKEKETYVMAAAIAGVTGMPLVIKVVQIGIISSWAMAESVADVRNLMDGKKVAVIKSPEQWNLSLQQITNIGGVTKEEDDKGGLGYEDYLRFLLSMQKYSDQIKRTMNIIQLNMQKRYNEEFKFSNCINSVQVRCEYTIKKLFNNFAPSFATGDGYSIPISQKYRY